MAARCFALAAAVAARTSAPEPGASSQVIAVIQHRADFLAANRGLRVARPGFVLLANPNGGRGMPRAGALAAGWGSCRAACPASASFGGAD